MSLDRTTAFIISCLLILALAFLSLQHHIYCVVPVKMMEKGWCWEVRFVSGFQIGAYRPCKIE